MTGEMVSTGCVEVELRVTGNAVEVYFCDAQGARWAEGVGIRSECTRDDVLEELKEAMRSCGDELAESLVKDLFDRGLVIAKVGAE